MASRHRWRHLDTHNNTILKFGGNLAAMPDTTDILPVEISTHGAHALVSIVEEGACKRVSNQGRSNLTKFPEHRECSQVSSSFAPPGRKGKEEKSVVPNNVKTNQILWSTSPDWNCYYFMNSSTEKSHSTFFIIYYYIVRKGC